MKKSFFLFLLATVLLSWQVSSSHAFSFFEGNALSNTFTIKSFSAVPDNGEMTVVAQACPPYLLGNMTSGSELQPQLSQLITNRVNQWKQQNEKFLVTRTSFNSQHETSMMRDAASGNRCTVATAHYTIAPKPQQQAQQASTVALVTAGGAKPVLKVGLRDNFPMISKKNGDTWDGADVIFAQAIARKLNADVQFVEMPNLQKSLSAAKFGMVDLSIALISYRPERAKENVLSDPYFKTGIVAATLNLETLGKANAEGFNDPMYTAIVASGTTAESLVKEQFPKMKVQAVSSTPDVYETAKKIELQNKEGASNIIMITDEAIAMTWPGSFVIEYQKKRLYTEDVYVVAARTPEMKKVIDGVIAQDKIPQMYTELVGR